MDRSNRLTSLATLFCMASLTACGGSSSAPAPSPAPTPAPQTVQGVQTPSSVSVVTAKNAQ